MTLAVLYENSRKNDIYKMDSPLNLNRSPKVMKKNLYFTYQDTNRYDSLKKLQAEGLLDTEVLKHAPWYQAGIPREIALEILSQEEIGAFIVRDSTTHAGCFALSVKVPKYNNPHGIAHYLVQRTPKGVRLKGLDKEWPSLSSLVIHHTKMAELLPCTLKLPTNSKNPSFYDYDSDDIEGAMDDDYQRLTDFSSMMNDMK